MLCLTSYIRMSAGVAQDASRVQYISRTQYTPSLRILTHPTFCVANPRANLNSNCHLRRRKLHDSRPIISSLSPIPPAGTPSDDPAIDSCIHASFHFSYPLLTCHPSFHIAVHPHNHLLRGLHGISCSYKNISTDVSPTLLLIA